MTKTNKPDPIADALDRLVASNTAFVAWEEIELCKCTDAIRRTYDTHPPSYDKNCSRCGRPVPTRA